MAIRTKTCPDCAETVNAEAKVIDEKMNGTMHLALGNGIPECGGQNQSSIHWDIVKDLRSGGRIELDGEVVQKNGVWNLPVPA